MVAMVFIFLPHCLKAQAGMKVYLTDAGMYMNMKSIELNMLVLKMFNWLKMKKLSMQGGPITTLLTCYQTGRARTICSSGKIDQDL